MHWSELSSIFAARERWRDRREGKVGKALVRWEAEMENVGRGVRRGCGGEVEL